MSARRPYDLALGVALLVSLGLFVLPLFFFLRQSFYESLGMGMVGDQLTLRNYVDLLTDPFYLQVFWRTTRLSAAAALVGLLLAFPTAYTLARSSSPLVRGLIVLLLITAFVSIVVKVLGLTVLMGSQGPIAALLRRLAGSAPSMLHNEFAVLVGLVQYSLPLLVMLLFGVIQTIPRSLEEAAAVCGASDWRLFCRILLPLSLNGVLTAGLIAFNMNMGAFTSAVLLGGGNVLTVPVLIQRKIVLDVDYAVAAALAVVLAVSVFAINLAVAVLRRSPTGAARLRRAA
jgi:putative spermidine/putrescine transport system permease protein